MKEEILLDKYEIREKIGRGGTGWVYQAYDRHLRQVVAIKQIVRGSQDSAKPDSLWNEAEVLKGLEHPALPRIYDYFQKGECDYLVLEYIEGMTLEEYIREHGPLQQGEAAVLMKGLLSVFLYLHSLCPPILYRDLKPANIMRKEDGQIKLIDFGTAMVSYEKGSGVRDKILSHSGGAVRLESVQPKPVRSAARREKECQVVAGTPGFSAPEVLQKERGGEECQESSDIYSLGAVFHYILTGLKPQSLSWIRRPVREYNRAVSEGTEKIIARCLREKAEERYQNIQQVLQDMELDEKRECKKKLWGKISRMTTTLLTALGILLLMSEAKNGICLPILRNEAGWTWEKNYEISPAVMRGVVLLFGGIGCGYLFRIIGGIKTRPDTRQEKSICLTGKRTAGLWSGSLLVGWVILVLAGRGRENPVYAEGAFRAAGLQRSGRSGEMAYAEEPLPVTVRDTEGYKILIREGAVYQPLKDVILELPLKGIPREEELVLQVVISGKEKQYQSREFLIRIPVDR